MKLFAVSALALVAVGAYAQVNVDIYKNFSDSGSDITFTNLAGSFSSPAITFATDTGYNWHPLGQTGNFAADIHGSFYAPVTGDYSIGLDSDDGSYLFVNGALKISNGGGHGPTFVSTSAPIHLVAGVATPFEVKFEEQQGGNSGVDLRVKGPNDTSYKNAPASFYATPEPATMTALALGAIALIRRRKTK